MYDWILDTKDNSGSIITANRHLARLLRKEFIEKKRSSTKDSWRTPTILSWQDWLIFLTTKVFDQENFPTYINKNQSLLLWETILRKEIDNSAVLKSNLAILCLNTWQITSDWKISIADIVKTVQNKDQRLFAQFASRYTSMLERKNLIDDAGLPAVILEYIEKDIIKLSGSHTFVGFIRERPIIKATQDLLKVKGHEVRIIPAFEFNTEYTLKSYENFSAELRAAGAWARKKYAANPSSRIGIVVSDLDKNTDLITRSVREGLTPGWQYSHISLKKALNVSYGRQLSDYPSIAILNLLIRWLVQDLSSMEVGALLRSPLLGVENISGRVRLELRLRQIPDRQWSPQMFINEFQSKDNEQDVESWISILIKFNSSRQSLPDFASFSEWALVIKEVIDQFNWPGERSLDSPDFQLINRWYELLDEFSQLGIISKKMTPNHAISYLEKMTFNALFQPETKDAIIELLGPLDASGAEFDALWIADVTSNNWPPSRARPYLISKKLQDKNNMPDCNSNEILQHASLLLNNLIASSVSTVVSYSTNIDDSDQTASFLLEQSRHKDQNDLEAPCLHAVSLLKINNLEEVNDPVPAVLEGEQIIGGAKTIQQQHEDPISAFLFGRLGINIIYPQVVGLPASMRGSIIHQALYKLYIDLPSRESIRSWSGNALQSRILKAINFAFIEHEDNADNVLIKLLKIERRRVEAIFYKLIKIDSNRPFLNISSVEGRLEFVFRNIRLSLRFDRIDTFSDGTIEIIDYKTGSKKRLLNKKNIAEDLQLFLYAMSSDKSVSSLTFVNIDSREISFDGAGVNYENTITWPNLLEKIRLEIHAILENLSAGDVRINLDQNFKKARQLNLLTRFTELQRDQS
tara:strand:- start:1907 stop:4498 length:2592 start_codon:yes stop_codon:yes gene_type:complete